jgi:hypothetical protein
MDDLLNDYFVTSQAFTRTTYRNVYPTIEPKSPSNSQAGKVVVITGASKGLGRRVEFNSIPYSPVVSNPNFVRDSFQLLRTQGPEPLLLSRVMLSLLRARRKQFMPLTAKSTSWQFPPICKMLRPLMLCGRKSLRGLDTPMY